MIEPINTNNMNEVRFVPRSVPLKRNVTLLTG